MNRKKMYQKPLGHWEGKFLHPTNRKNTLYVVMQGLLKLPELAELPLNCFT